MIDVEEYQRLSVVLIFVGLIVLFIIGVSAIADTSAQNSPLSQVDADCYNPIPIAQPSTEIGIRCFLLPNSTHPSESYTVSTYAEVLSNETRQVTFYYSIEGEIQKEKTVQLTPEGQKIEFNNTITDLKPGNYTHRIFGGDASVTDQIQVTARATDCMEPLPFPGADVIVTCLRGPASVEQNSSFFTSVRLDGFHDTPTTVTVNYQLAGNIRARKKVNFSGGSKIVVFQVNVTGLSPGNYTHSVFSDHGAASGNITIAQSEDLTTTTPTLTRTTSIETVRDGTRTKESVTTTVENSPTTSTPMTPPTTTISRTPLSATSTRGDSGSHTSLIDIVANLLLGVYKFFLTLNPIIQFIAALGTLLGVYYTHQERKN